MPPLIDKVEEVSLTPVQKFYSGANIFITGGTGFIGRLLIEKLLRSCPDIGNIYVLIRNKKDKSLHDRIEELLDDVVFERLADEFPKFRHKVGGIEGDVGLPALGINDQDWKLLTTEVSVVFHVAATVKFDETLKQAVAINVRGTRDVIRLSKEMTHLKALVHVSTAYTNCTEDFTEEVFYPTPIDGKGLINLTEILDESIQNKATKDILGRFPNTYAFTKAVAENIVLDEDGCMPIAVFRPAIIISTYKEPIKGWINNLYGPTGVAAGAATGILRSLNCDANVNANMVPADMTVNALIALAWELEQKYLEAKQKGTKFEIPIYQYESSTDQPITWGTYMSYNEFYGLQYPSVHALGYYLFHLRKNPIHHFIAILFLHYLPAFLVDAVLFCIGKKPRLLKIYKKIHKFSRVITYFCTKNFRWKSTRVRDMIANMSPQDQSIFFCDLKKLDWEDYYKLYIKGLRIYLLKDPITTLPEAKKKWMRLYWGHQICKAVVCLIAAKLAWMGISYSYQLIL